ncbi:MAG: hypothetical protein QOD06_2687 [Candidatus Binatota bacterium]|nr:hypothetical protein [Candidatus Binatota bacterium]
MDFLNPGGLVWLAALPLLLVPYLLRERTRRRLVPALFLYEGIARTRRLRLFGVPRLEPLFWLQLLLLALLAVAIARPALTASTTRGALVLDDSASMQAPVADGGTRLDRARRAALEAIAADPARIWDVFALSPAPRALGAGLTAEEARERASGLRASDAPHPDAATLRTFLEGLARRGYGTIHVVGAFHPATGPRLEVVDVSEPAANAGITAVTVAGGSVEVVIGNFSASPVTRNVVFEETGGRVIASRPIGVAARGSRSVTVSLAGGATYRVHLEPRDVFPLDDEIALPLVTRERSLLVVSDGGLAGLDALKKPLGLRIDTVAPGSFRVEDAARRDLVIFHLAAPTEPIAVPALYLLPPPASFLPAPTRSADHPALGLAEPTHPAVRYVAAGALAPRRALLFDRAPGWNPLVVSGAGAALLVTERPVRAVVSGIDLLPFVADRNRPASILLLDLLSWLAPGGGASVAPTGTPLHPGEGALRVRLPDGTVVEPARGAVRADRQGLYWIEYPDRREPVARALLSARESSLESAPELPAPGEFAPVASERTVRPLWRTLSFAAIALLLLEAVLQFARRGGFSPFAVILRVAVLAIVGLAAVDPSWTAPAEHLPPVLLVDVSASVPAPVRAAKTAELRRKFAPSSVKAFAEKTAATTIAGLEGVVSRVGPAGTNIESALAAAALDAPPGAALLLLTDGWETRGAARSAVGLLVDRSVRVYPVPVAEPPTANVEVARLSLPAEAQAGNTVRAAVLLHNRNREAVTGRVVIRRGDRTLAAEPVRLSPGDNLITRSILIDGSGLLGFSAAIEGVRRERNAVTDDDVARAWISAGGRPAVLIVGRNRGTGRYVERALEARGIPVRSVDAGFLPSLDGIGAVVLNDVPISALGRGGDEAIQDYVRRGGGLVMTGGPSSFGLGGYLGSAIEDALPVRMKPRARQEPRLAVALVVDKSGSMREEGRMSYAQEAARQLVDHLDPRDRLMVVGFDREAFVVVPLREVGDIRSDFERRISRIRPEGGTRLYPALIEARRALADAVGRRRHIIVLSDGLSEDADTARGQRRYYDLALALHEQGVTISTIALGGSADARFLERIAGYGRGAFHQTLDPSTLPELVLGEFQGPTREKTMREEETSVRADSGSPIVGEIARADPRWPPILGLVETELKPGAELDVGARGAEGEPVIASWTYGSGRAVAFTTDAYGRWSDRWVRWREWSRIWSGIAAWLLPPVEGGKADFRVAYGDGGLTVEYVRYDADPPGPIVARVSGPENAGGELVLERTAPGSFRGTLPTRTAGDYRIVVSGPRGVLTNPALGFTVPRSDVAERPRSEPNWALLQELADATGGRMNPAPSDVHGPAASPRSTPLAPWLLPLAIALFLVELIVRRLGRRTVDREEPARQAA